MVTSFWPSRLPAALAASSARADQLHAVLLGIGLDRSLAASAGMDLGFDDGDRLRRVRETRRRLRRPSGRQCLAARRPPLRGDLFGLIFVDLHDGLEPVNESAGRRGGEKGTLPVKPQIIGRRSEKGQPAHIAREGLESKRALCA